MAIFTLHHPLILIFGILGNIFSFMVYLAPLPTFYGVYKKKSTQGFQSVPYLFALLSSMIWIYYALLKSDACLLITINSIGCAMETLYITVFITYAPRKARILTSQLFILLNVGVFSSVVLLTFFLAKGAHRVSILGWVCVAVSASVFAAPFSVMRMVIRTKSVQFLPFSLSFFLTLSAIMWFSYGLLLKDYFIAIPNVLGFIFGTLQMLIYLIYRGNNNINNNNNNNTINAEILPEEVLDDIKPSTPGASEVLPIQDEDKMRQDIKMNAMVTCEVV